MAKALLRCGVVVNSAQMLLQGFDDAVELVTEKIGKRRRENFHRVAQLLAPDAQPVQSLDLARLGRRRGQKSVARRLEPASRGLEDCGFGFSAAPTDSANDTADAAVVLAFPPALTQLIDRRP